jgi:pimeloyl-ACP methyl ester carboxylesterase
LEEQEDGVGNQANTTHASPACPIHPGRLSGFPLSQYRDEDAHRTVFFDAGAGEPLVFVHGLGGNLTHWQFVAPELARSHRVLGLDLPGFGESLRPDGPYSYDLMAESVLSFMDRRGVAKATIVGHSFGGAVATQLALEHPERVRAIVLVNPAGYHRFPRWMQEGSRVVLHPAVLVPSLFGSVYWILKNVCRADRPEVRAFRRSATKLRGGYKFLDDMAFAAHSLRPDLVGRHFLGRLGELSLPVHMVWGGDDRLLPPSDGLEAVKAMPDARVTVVPGVGHMPIFEAPETVLAAIRDVQGRSLARAGHNMRRPLFAVA